MERGNINLQNQPIIRNPDGSTSTVYSMGFQDNGQEVLIPGINDRRQLTFNEAVDQYRKTGRHLGKFNTAAESDAYANQLHKDYMSGRLGPMYARGAEQMFPEQYAPNQSIPMGLPIQLPDVQPYSMSDIINRRR